MQSLGNKVAETVIRSFDSLPRSFKPRARERAFEWVPLRRYSPLARYRSPRAMWTTANVHEEARKA